MRLDCRSEVDNIMIVSNNDAGFVCTCICDLYGEKEALVQWCDPSIKTTDHILMIPFFWMADKLAKIERLAA